MQYEQTQLQPDRDLHPALERALALHRQVAGEALELEVALRRRGRRTAGTRRACRSGPGPNATSTNGNCSKTCSFSDCDQQPPTPTTRRRVLGLQALGLAEVADQPVVGRLADRAGVEQDQVGAVALGGLLVAERLEHALHALGVVLVHLAPEGGEVVLLHRDQMYTHHKVDHEFPGGIEAAHLLHGLLGAALRLARCCASCSATPGWRARPTEFFDPELMRRFRERWGAETLGRVPAPRCCATKTSPNGVFGVKVHWGQLQPALGDADPGGVFPDLRYVHMRRERRAAPGGLLGAGASRPTSGLRATRRAASRSSTVRRSTYYLEQIRTRGRGLGDDSSPTRAGSCPPGRVRAPRHGTRSRPSARCSTSSSCVHGQPRSRFGCDRVRRHRARSMRGRTHAARDELGRALRRPPMRRARSTWSSR